jgi:hypothetical protein
MPKLAQIKAPRMTDWLIITAILFIIIYQVAPQQLPLSVYKLSLVTMAAVFGYWIDRSAFPLARPHRFMQKAASPGSPYVSEVTVAPTLQIAFAACMLRRAIIIGAAMIAASLGI